MADSPYANYLQGRNIRLLRLHPGEADTSLQCDLVVASLDDSPTYEALSYAWGDSEVTDTILCNGSELAITVNLARALRRIRRGLTPPKATPQHNSENSSNSKAQSVQTSSVGSLWIDAVCIDQTNVTERNHQVQLMKEIYTNAVRVIIWLGDTRADDEQILATAAAIESVCSRSAGSTQDAESKTIYENLNNAFRHLDWPDNWSSIDATFSSEWFRRTWCVQEAKLASQLIALFDRMEFDDVQLSRFSDWAQDRWLRSCSANVHIGNTTNILWAKFGASRLHGMDPLDVLSEFRDHIAKDPRDKVYGLLGLMDEDLVEVDYGKSVTEVYTDVVLYSITRYPHVLSHVDHPSGFEPVEDFPSWIPRWNIRPRSSALFFDLQCSVSAGRRQHIPLERDLAQRGILRMHGLLFDRVTSLTRSLKGFQQVDTDIGELLSGFTDLYTTSISVLALALTLTGGWGPPHGYMSDLDSHRVKQLLVAFAAFTKSHIPKWDHLDWGLPVVDEEWIPSYARFVRSICAHRRFFCTDKGCFGLGPRSMRLDDIIAVFHNHPHPLVLRPARDGKDQYYFMGDCFIYDIARGEAYDMLGRDGVVEKVFDLI